MAETIENKYELEAMEWLKSPDLLEKIVGVFEGIIPEQHNQKKLMTLVLASSWLKSKTEKLHLMINSESSVGKSFFMKRFMKMISPLRYRNFTRISPKALNYYGANKEDWTWNNKLLFLEDVSEDIVNSDAVKVFLSEGSDIVTLQNQKAIHLKVNGSPVIVLTMCEPTPKKEILNRFVLMNLDETTEQTRKVLNSIAAEYTNKRPEINPTVFWVWKKLQVADARVDFADKIVPWFPIDDVRVRRDYKRFLTLVCASTILHQYQREKDEDGRFISTEQDYEIAREIFDFITAAGDIDLTHTQKKALTSIKKLKLKVTLPSPEALPLFLSREGNDSNDSNGGVIEFTARQIYNLIPTRAYKNWIILLNKLAEKGYLRVLDKQNPTTRRDATFYSLVQGRNNKYHLPKFADLANPPASLLAFSKNTVTIVTSSNLRRENELTSDTDVNGGNERSFEGNVTSNNPVIQVEKIEEDS